MERKLLETARIALLDVQMNMGSSLQTEDYYDLQRAVAIIEALLQREVTQ